MRFLRSFGLAVSALVVIMAPAPILAGSEAEEPPTPTVLEATPEEVTKLTDAVTKAYATKNNSLLTEALVLMDTHSDDSFKPLIKKALSSKDKKVLAAAIRAAASHQMEGEKKTVLKLLKATKKAKKKKKKKGGNVSGLVAAAAVDYLARLAIESIPPEDRETAPRTRRSGWGGRTDAVASSRPGPTPRSHCPRLCDFPAPPGACRRTNDRSVRAAPRAVALLVATRRYDRRRPAVTSWRRPRASCPRTRPCARGLRTRRMSSVCRRVRLP